MKLPHAYTRRRAVGLLSAEAFRLHMLALDWCAEQRTNGAIAEEDISMLPRIPRSWRALTVELVAAGLWEQVGALWALSDAERTDPDLSAKRAEAGRAGGLAKALALAKQTASKLPSTLPPGEVASCQEFASLPGGAAPPPLTLSPSDTSSQVLDSSGSSPDSSALPSSGSGPDRLPARGSKSARSKPRTEAPDWIEPTTRQREIASERGIDLNVEIERCLAHHRGKGNLMASWSSVLTTWLTSPYAKSPAQQQAASKLPGQNFNRLNARIARMELEEAEREAH